MRLEPDMWDALKEICALENISIHEFCRQVEEQREESAFTAAIRVAILAYYRDKVKELSGKHQDMTANHPSRDCAGNTESESSPGPKNTCAHAGATENRA